MRELLHDALVQHGCLHCVLRHVLDIYRAAEHAPPCRILTSPTPPPPTLPPAPAPAPPTPLPSTRPVPSGPLSCSTGLSSGQLSRGPERRGSLPAGLGARRGPITDHRARGLGQAPGAVGHGPRGGAGLPCAVLCCSLRHACAAPQGPSTNASTELCVRAAWRSGVGPRRTAPGPIPTPCSSS